MNTQIELFANLLAEQQELALVQQGYTPELHNYVVTVKIGKKFAKVDIGLSGRYMVDLATGEIFGIKAYGVVHRGHRFGTLHTIQDWDWRGYYANPKQTVETQS